MYIRLLYNTGRANWAMWTCMHAVVIQFLYISLFTQYRNSQLGYVDLYTYCCYTSLCTFDFKHSKGIVNWAMCKPTVVIPFCVHLYFPVTRGESQRPLLSVVQGCIHCTYSGQQKRVTAQRAMFFSSISTIYIVAKSHHV